MCVVCVCKCLCVCFNVWVGACVLQCKRTPLHYSCDLALTTLLLDRGADMTLADAVSHTHTNEFSLVWRSLSVFVAVLFFFQCLHVCVVACVLQYKWTPLHSSCYKGHLALTTLLLDRGADMTLADAVSHTYTHTHRASAMEVPYVSVFSYRVGV